jgi:hypothetical protein
VLSRVLLRDERVAIPDLTRLESLIVDALQEVA